MPIPISTAVHEASLCGNACLVIIVEIDPATQTINRLPPLRCKSHDNGAAFCIVFIQPKLHDSISTGKPQLLVNLIFNRQTMCVPAETPLHIVALHGPVPRNDVFDRRCEEMSIVG